MKVNPVYPNLEIRFTFDLTFMDQDKRFSLTDSSVLGVVDSTSSQPSVGTTTNSYLVVRGYGCSWAQFP